MEKDYYYRVMNDWNYLPDFMDHFYAEYEIGKKEVGIRGNIERSSAELPTNAEKRFTQCQVVNAVVDYFEMERDKCRSEKLKFIMMNSNRALSERTAEKYLDSDEELINLEQIITQVNLLKNCFVGLSKAFEYKHYQLTNITKLRSAGLEDSRIED